MVVAARFSSAALVTAAAAGVLVLGSLGGRDGGAPELARISLAAGDGALFSARQLVPGHEVSNCVRITHAGREVRLQAADLSGPLVAGLRMRVELGTGGTLGDCSGFTGATVYEGPLTGLAVAGGVATGWTPATTESRTYRLTVDVAGDDTLQHTSGGATLRWLLNPGAGATPRTPTGPAPTSPGPTSSVTPPRGAPVAGQPAVTPSIGVPPVTPVGPARSGTPAPGVAAEPGGEAGRSPWSESLGAVVRGAWQLLDATARHPWHLLFSLAAMWLLLFAVDRSDRRDPKLALAPVLREPYLEFTDNNEVDRGEPKD
ncbi:hypothetical protein Aab01nite_78200 [Paractinoplanes abujensis]|uniref:Uncharacterized protein n=1 Tax=Paractinoplanes abujensis TaxID=882441 RepID=A0A7W7G334_9ACTN|nr:hypothetical protein [Actinoplanes abujensis]MBB4692291.1 hypothetical protein [Actinoplanes abujensis]GID24230.1 hypothetical protein Aab01nite_78200 [Actinoplanes abujensis]